MFSFKKSKILFFFKAKPQCFSMTDMAKTPLGMEILIKDLKIGDKVLATDHYDRVITTEIISFLHYENNSQGKIQLIRKKWSELFYSFEAFFYTFKTETGHNISLTSDHLIFIGNQTYLQARFVDPEQHKLYVVGPDGRLKSTRIRSIDVHLQQGYATPVTQHGTLIVNDVSASCYSSIYHHNLGHMAMAPLRMFHQAKQILGIASKNETPTNGIHWYPRTLNNIVHMFGPLANVYSTTMGKI